MEMNLEIVDGDLWAWFKEVSNKNKKKVSTPPLTDT